MRESASDFFCSHPQSSLDGRSVSLTPLFPLREDRTAQQHRRTLGLLCLAALQAAGCFIFSLQEEQGENSLTSFFKMFFNPFLSILHAAYFLYNDGKAKVPLKRRGEYFEVPEIAE